MFDSNILPSIERRLKARFPIGEKISKESKLPTFTNETELCKQHRDAHAMEESENVRLMISFLRQVKCRSFKNMNRVPWTKNRQQPKVFANDERK
jgi:hypothetical protein